MRKEWNEDLPAFISAQKHFFLDLVERIHQVADPRQQHLYFIYIKSVDCPIPKISPKGFDDYVCWGCYSRQ